MGSSNRGDSDTTLTSGSIDSIGTLSPSRDQSFASTLNTENEITTADRTSFQPQMSSTLLIFPSSPQPIVDYHTLSESPTSSPIFIERQIVVCDRTPEVSPQTMGATMRGGQNGVTGRHSIAPSETVKILLVHVSNVVLSFKPAHRLQTPKVKSSS